MSASFRKGGDVTFIVEELKAVFDPKGGFFRKGVYVNSVVAEIGNVVEKHLLRIGMLEHKELPQIVKEKKEALGGIPESAMICNKCHAKAVVKSDGCMVCLACGDSKCG
jgi:hypothetical protein